MRRVLIVFFFFLFLQPAQAFAEDIVADISSHQVQVTTGFTGAELIVFGSTDKSGDVAIVIEGPSAKATVRKKARLLGVWVNTDSYVFDDVPGYYAIATSKPIAAMALPSVITKKKLSLDKIDFPARDGDARSETYRQALLQRRAARGFYREDPSGVSILSNRLFRSSFTLPANVPIGAYKVYIYLLKDGRVLSSEALTFSVAQIGLSATIVEAAKTTPVFYAIASLMMAVAMGGGSAWLFRRMS